MTAEFVEHASGLERFVGIEAFRHRAWNGDHGDA